MRLRRNAGRLAVSTLAAVPLVGMLGMAPVLDSAIPLASPPPPSSTAPASTHRVLALGDSVPAGAACGCEPFPVTYGNLLARRTGTKVSVENRAVSGLTTSQLVAQLHESGTEDAVRRSDVVLVTIGANDFADHHDEVETGACTTSDTDCVSDELASLREQLSLVLSRIRGLRAGRPTTVLVTGYWNVFEDGDVARQAYGTTGLDSSLQLTRRANAVIEEVATGDGARYVELLQPFQQADGDITSLMAADGDHPDAAGHELIARALLAAGLPRTD